MKKLIDYEILEAFDKYDLEKEVKKHIELGYELYGSPFIRYDKIYKKDFFYQAIVKFEEM